VDLGIRRVDFPAVRSNAPDGLCTAGGKGDPETDAEWLFTATPGEQREPEASDVSGPNRTESTKIGSPGRRAGRGEPPYRPRKTIARPETATTPPAMACAHRSSGPNGTR
jgi:hypothetical protein